LQAVSCPAAVVLAAVVAFIAVAVLAVAGLLLPLLIPLKHFGSYKKPEFA